MALRLAYPATVTVEGDELLQPVALNGLEAVTAMIDADRHALPVQLRVTDVPCACGFLTMVVSGEGEMRSAHTGPISFLGRPFA